MSRKIYRYNKESKQLEEVRNEYELTFIELNRASVDHSFFDAILHKDILELTRTLEPFAINTKPLVINKKEIFDYVK